MKYQGNLGEKKPEGFIGWCHHCGMVQSGSLAKYATREWGGKKKMYLCYFCKDEPWGDGVWPLTCPDHELAEVYAVLGKEVNQPPAFCECHEAPEDEE